jgi:hypothetical protein
MMMPHNDFQHRLKGRKMTTPNGSPAQGVSRATAGSAAEDARRQAAASGSRVLGTDQDDASTGMEDVTAQRGRISSQTGGNTPATSPTVTRDN